MNVCTSAVMVHKIVVAVAVWITFELRPLDLEEEEEESWEDALFTVPLLLLCVAVHSSATVLQLIMWSGHLLKCKWWARSPCSPARSLLFQAFLGWAGHYKLYIWALKTWNLKQTSFNKPSTWFCWFTLGPCLCQWGLFLESGHDKLAQKSV